MPRFIRGFGYALRGITAAVREERNLRVHICAAVYVLVFSLFYAFSPLEYTALALIVTGMMALELMNSAIERIVDGLSPGPKALAGTVKDMAAGAVLVFTLGAVICGLILFWDVAVFRRILAFFAARPLCIALLAASLCLAAWWVFGWGRRRADANRNIHTNGDKFD